MDIKFHITSTEYNNIKVEIFTSGSSFPTISEEFISVAVAGEWIKENALIGMEMYNNLNRPVGRGLIHINELISKM